MTKTSGTQRQHSRLAQKRVILDRIYADTPRIYPETRQIKRQEARVKLKELLSLTAKEARKVKRGRKRAEKEIEKA